MLLIGGYQAYSYVRAQQIVNESNIESLIKDWVLGLGFTLKEVQDKDNVFDFEVTHDGRPLTVFKPRDSGYIHVLGAFSVGPDHQKQLAALNEFDRNEIVIETRMKMIELGIDFQPSGAPLTKYIIGRRAPIGISSMSFNLPE